MRTLRITLYLACSCLALATFGAAAARADALVDQRRLAETIAKAKLSYKAASTEIQRTSVRIGRKQEICAFGTPEVRNWYGRVVDVKSENDGSAGLIVDVKGFRLRQVATLFSSGNFIKPDHPLYRTYLTLKPGDLVAFHGHFQTGDKDCFREMSVTENGAMIGPDFVFDFSEVTSYGKIPLPDYLE